MTYRNLLMMLYSLTQDELDCDVSIVTQDSEVFKCDDFVDIIDVGLDDVLDSPHPVLLVAS